MDSSAILDPVVQQIALTMGVAWASGVNLYAAVLTLGYLNLTDSMVLPPGLQLLSDPLVMMVAGLLFVVEFFADKVPGLDSLWDGLHTFIRIPAGAILAAQSVGDVSAPVLFAAALAGGGIATVSHATKAGSRLLINTSPEPVTNWAASFGEDTAVVVGLVTAVHHPWAFMGLALFFTVLLIWLLPKVFRGLRGLWRRFRRNRNQPLVEESPHVH